MTDSAGTPCAICGFDKGHFVCSQAPAHEYIKKLVKERDLIDEAVELGVVVRGDFDDGAYGRYEESVYCGVVAYFQNTVFDSTLRARGKTVAEAILKLYQNVKDKQRFKEKRSNISRPPKESK